MSIQHCKPLHLDEDAVFNFHRHIVQLEHDLIDLKFATEEAAESGDFATALTQMRQTQDRLARAVEAIQQQAPEAAQGPAR